MRGRPPVTRARVLRYWEKHGPCPIREVSRALEMDRTDVKRILRRFAQVTPVLRTRLR
jgi:DNA-binding MarR family transcriptional regulator